MISRHMRLNLAPRLLISWQNVKVFRIPLNTDAFATLVLSPPKKATYADHRYRGILIFPVLYFYFNLVARPWGDEEHYVVVGRFLSSPYVS